jgi:PKD repeat protein
MASALIAASLVAATPALAATTVVAEDHFARTVESGWGSAPTGGAWSRVSGTSVSGGEGRITLTKGQTKSPTLAAVSAKDVTSGFTFSADKIADSGGLYIMAPVRKTSAGEYRLKLRIYASGSMTQAITKLVGSTETTIRSRVLPGKYTAGTKYSVAFDAHSQGSTTTLRASVWPAAVQQPAWQFTATDGTTALQVAGAVGVAAYLSSGATNGPVTVSVDDVRTVAGQPVDLTPKADFTATIDSLGVQFLSTSTAIEGGYVRSQSWDFGDGTSSTAFSVNHRYAASGTYPVTLTVTDNLGRVSTPFIRPVTVTHQDPVADFSYAADGLTVEFSRGPDYKVYDNAEVAVTWDFGDGSRPGSGLPIQHSFPAPGTYTVTATLTDFLGGTAEPWSAEVTVDGDPVPEPDTVEDQFDREVMDGWGEATWGGEWATSAGFSVASHAGDISTTAGSTSTARLVEPTGLYHGNMNFRLDSLPDGDGYTLDYIARSTAAGEYRARLHLASTGDAEVSVLKVVGGVETILASGTPVNWTYVAGAAIEFAFRFSDDGAGGTDLSAGVMNVGVGPFPEAWDVTANDAQPELQGPGSVGLSTSVSATTTTGPVVTRVSLFQALAI